MSSHVVQMPLPVGGRRAIELYALGNAKVEGVEYKALGHRITYAQAKEVLTLEGDGRIPAELFQPKASRRPGNAAPRAKNPLLPQDQGRRGRRSANAGSPAPRREMGRR